MSDEQHEQVHDQGTGHMDGDQVANAAAESLHGAKAEEEQYPQPDAAVLPGGGTLIAEPTKRDDGTAGKGRLSDRQ